MVDIVERNQAVLIMAKPAEVFGKLSDLVEVEAVYASVVAETMSHRFEPVVKNFAAIDPGVGDHIKCLAAASPEHTASS